MFLWTNVWLLGARTFKLYPNMQYVTFPVPAMWRCGHCQILQLNCVEDVTMRESLIEIGRCICERSLCHGAPWQRLSTAHVYFYWSKFQFTSKHGSSESTSGLFANTKRLLHLFAGWLFVKVKAVENRLGDYLSHSSVQCSLLGPSFLLRSFNTTYSLKSGHKCFCTIQPGLQNLSPSSQWWEQEMIGWCPHILYPNGHQF